MIERIRNHPVLSKHIVEACCENGVCADIDLRISKSDYVIIKVDSYYNGLPQGNPPPSPDCLIIQRCERGKGFALTIVELKHIKSSHGLNVENVLQKFDTVLSDFILRVFKDLLGDEEYVRIELLFISRYERNSMDISLKARALQSKRLKFKDRSLMLTLKRPNPVLKPCYAT